MTVAPSQRLVITGTDTNVGKTHVTCLIARLLRQQQFRVGVYKPVCSGAIGWSPDSAIDAGHARWDDIERIKAVTGRDWPDEVICPQRFLAPLAPPVAARREGRQVSFEQILDGVNPFSSSDLLLIEGAGGWLSPLTDEHSLADLAVKLQAPVLIVARTGLGTINHTLLTIEAIRHRGLKVAGVIMNEATPHSFDLSSSSNSDEIRTRGNVHVFGSIRHGEEQVIQQDGSPANIDWLQDLTQVANTVAASTDFGSNSAPLT